MRELLTRIKFTKDCLGNVRRMTELANNKSWPCFYMPRTQDGRIRFEPNWWRSSFRFAAKVLCRHQRAANKIYVDGIVEGRTDTNPENFYKRYVSSSKYFRHEAFREGDIVGINCLAPNEIGNEDFHKLMDLVGRFRGISPFGPREYGFFVVDSIKDKNPKA